jgi:hypothetical protein
MTHAAQRRGMTLVEIVVAASLASLLAGGLVSALVLTGRALPGANRPTDVLARDAAALDKLSADLFGASAIVDHTAHRVEFNVADRDNDGNPEVLCYEWSGVVGDPLLFTYNGKAATMLIDSVADFALDYTVTVRSSTTQQTVTTDSGEVTLASFSGWAGVTGSTVTGYLLGANSWPAEYLKITTAMPNNLVRLEITKVTLLLKDSSATAENLTCTLYATAVAGGPLPNLTRVYGTPSVRSDSGLTASYAPISFGFTDVSFTTPITELVFGIRGSAGLGIRAQYVTNASAPSNDTQTMLWTTDNGSTWQPAASSRNRNDMYYTVSGRIYTSTTQDVTVDTYFVAGVSAALRSTNGTTTAFTLVQALNTPQVDSP